MTGLARLAPVLALASLSLAGCGPTVPLNANVKVDYFNVATATPSPPPTPPPPPRNVAVLPVFPSIETPPPARPRPVATAAPLAIPTASPSPPPSCPGQLAASATPAVAATAAATRPPSAASYPFRYSGTYQLAGQTTTLPATGTRAVENPSAVSPNGSFTFQVAETYNAMSTIVTYLVEPVTQAPPAVGSTAVQAGLYLQQMTTTDAAGQPASFTPATPVYLMPYPASSGALFEGDGLDPLTQRAMEIDPGGGTVVNHDRVNACGVALDSWQVHILGRFVNSRTNVVQSTFDWTFDAAPQFGGLLLAEHFIETGMTDTASPQAFTYDLTDSIDVAPQAPAP